MGYVELGKECRIGLRRVKRYAEPPQKPKCTLGEPKPTKVVAKQLLKQEDSTLNRQFVRDNFMVGIKYSGLTNLNGWVPAWYNKVNGKVHAITNEIPFSLRRIALQP